MFGFFDVIQDILSNLRTFGLRDVIDIAVVSLAMYQIFLFARKSRAGQLVRGLLLLLVFYALADVMQLRTVRWVLTNVMQIGFIAAIVLFQPELRRTLAVYHPPAGPHPAWRMAERRGGHLRCSRAAFRYAYRRIDGAGTHEQPG